MSNTPNFDAKIKTILETLQPGERVCGRTGEKWVMTEREIEIYKKYGVPPHPWSPAERVKQVCTFFTMYQFWYQTHPETGKPFISVNHPGTKIPVLPDQEWFAKDFSHISQEADPHRSFFEQMKTLQMQIPIPGTKFIKKPERSISLASLGDVDSYFMMASRSRSSLFGSDIMDMEESAESYGGSHIKQSYRVCQSHRIYNCQFVDCSYDCTDSRFLFDCRNCDHCFGATNKRNKKYLWMNEQLSKEEWEKKFQEVDFSCRSRLEQYQQEFDELMKTQAVWPENFNEKCTNTIGEYMNNAVDCDHVFSGMDGPYRDCFWTIYLYGNTYATAFSGAALSSNSIYLTNTAINSSEAKMCHMVSNCQNVEYCFYCWDLENCFGCYGIRHKKFCIFNKQYSEEEYWQKLDELKCAMFDRGEYGIFFPCNFYPGFIMDGGLSMFEGTVEDAKDYGAEVFDPESVGATGNRARDAEVRDSATVPDCIQEVSDDEWLNVPLLDKEFHRTFAFIKPELDFYRAHHLPAPTKHFVRRVYDLFHHTNLPLFDEYVCKTCSKPVTIARNKIYSERQILCRACYLQYLEQNG